MKVSDLKKYQMIVESSMKSTKNDFYDSDWLYQTNNFFSPVYVISGPLLKKIADETRNKDPKDFMGVSDEQDSIISTMVTLQKHLNQKGFNIDNILKAVHKSKDRQLYVDSPETEFESAGIWARSRKEEAANEKFFVVQAPVMTDKIKKIVDDNVKKLQKGVKIFNHLILSGAKISNLPRGLRVLGDLMINDTNVEKLPEDLSVNGELWINGTKITELPKMRVVPEMIVCHSKDQIKNRSSNRNYAIGIVKKK